MHVAEQTIVRVERAWLRIRDRSLLFVLFTLIGTTLLHYLTDIHLIPYHSIYRSLYYLPIAVAAVRYGRRGGIVTALTASLLYMPHVVLSWGIMGDDGFNDLLENVIFLFVGVLAGSLADAERRQRKLAQVAAAQLTDANTQLQTQAVLAERMRASIESILESIDNGVLTLDLHGQVTTSNRAAHMLLGGSDTIEELVLPPIHAYVRMGGRGYQQVSINGRMLGLHGSALVGAAGETIGIVLVLDDLTELRALEEQVQRAQRLAALGRLASGLAHEIRNPLAITRAAAQMLQHDMAEHSVFGEYTQVIQTEIDRVDRLVDQLLAYTRPFPIQRTPVDISDVIERTVALTRAYAAQQSVILTAEIATGLPLVDGDAEQLHQALVNLLLNGIQATLPGGEVRVGAELVQADRQSSPSLTIKICDSGHGVVPDDLPHIFDPFFTTRVDGTGLGLSIVQQIVQQHGGTIAVRNTPRSGASFTMTLPALVA